MNCETDLNPHVPSERAEHFHAENSGATELEYLHLLTSLVLVSKPQLALETGAWTGAGTEALGSALKLNGFGRLISVERDPNACRQVRERLRDMNHVEVANRESLEFLNEYEGSRFDFAFLDSLLPVRAEELTVLLERRLLAPGSLVAIHDTSRVRESPAGRRDPESVEFWDRFARIQAGPHGTRLTAFEFTLSRGMLLIRAS